MPPLPAMKMAGGGDNKQGTQLREDTKAGCHYYFLLFCHDTDVRASAGLGLARQNLGERRGRKLCFVLAASTARAYLEGRMESSGVGRVLQSHCSLASLSVWEGTLGSRKRHSYPQGTGPSP